jgi:hypothetical protein
MNDFVFSLMKKFSTQYFIRGEGGNNFIIDVKFMIFALSIEISFHVKLQNKKSVSYQN